MRIILAIKTDWGSFSLEDVLFTGYLRQDEEISDIQILRDVCLHLNTDTKLKDLREKVQKLENNELVRRLYDKKDVSVLNFKPE